MSNDYFHMFYVADAFSGKKNFIVSQNSGPEALIIFVIKY